LASQADFLACWVRRGMGTARPRRMASLRLGLVAGKAWLAELRSGREFDLGLDRVPGAGFAMVRSARGRTRRGGRPPATLGLWDELPSGLCIQGTRLII
jgi:hypothetical protein